MTNILFLFGTLFIFSPIFFIIQFSIFFLIFILNKCKIPYIGLIFIFVSLISLFFHIFFFGAVNKILLFTIVCSFFALTVPAIYDYSAKRIKNYNWKNVIDFCIKFHIITFLLQYFAFNIFQLDIDYGKFLLGPPHRSSYNGFDYRATGVFAEPSIFSIHMLTLLVMRYIITNNNSLLCYIALICMVLSGSTFSVICVILFFLLTVRLTLKWITTGFISLILISPIIYQNIMWRMTYISSGNDGSTSYKLELLKTLFDSPIVFNFGHGMVGYYDNAPNYFQSLFDMTLFGSNLLVFGFWLGSLLSISWLIIFFSYFRFSFRLVLLCLLPCLKLTFLFPIFWLYLAFLVGYLGSKNEKYQTRYSTIQKFNR
ncbi:polymerase [Proteus mirabilis]|nr:polymerase [Proteus mirabilis]CAJ0558231.1 O-antigen polymerase [Proteus mirabilis]